MASGQKSREETIDLIIKDVITQNIYLIGTASSGPVNTPTRIHNLNHAIRVFGNRGSLIESYKAIKLLPKTQHVYFVKSTGTHGLIRLNVNVKNGSLLQNSFYFKSKNADEETNQVFIHLTDKGVIIHHPVSLGGKSNLYLYKDYPTLGEVINAINKDADEGLSALYAQTDAPLETLSCFALHVCNPDTLYMSGCSNGLSVNKDQYYYCLEDTYHVLEGNKIDVIVPVHAYYDDLKINTSSYGESVYGLSCYSSSADYLTLEEEGKRLSYYEQLVRFCHIQSMNGIWTHGVMGCRHDDERILMTQHQVVNSNNMYRAYNYLVSVVFGDLYYSYFDIENTAALAYATLISHLDVGKSPINKVSHESLALKTIMSKHTLKLLSEYGFVVYRDSLIHQTPTVHSAKTLHDANSEMNQFINVLMVSQVANAIQILTDQYIGSSLDTLMKQNRIKNELDYMLTSFKERGIVELYDLNIEEVEQSHIKVEVTLQTIYMLEEIKINGEIGFHI